MTQKIGFIRPKMVAKKSTGVPFEKGGCGGNKLSSEGEVMRLNYTMKRGRAGDGERVRYRVLRGKYQGSPEEVLREFKGVSRRFQESSEESPREFQRSSNNLVC